MALHIILITYLVLYFTGNLAPRAPRESRQQRRWQDDKIAYSMYRAELDRQEEEARKQYWEDWRSKDPFWQDWLSKRPTEPMYNPPQPTKGMPLIGYVVVWLPILIFVGGGFIRLLIS